MPAKNVLNIDFPATSLYFYANDARKQNKSALDRIYSTYKKEIDTASELTLVPVEIIISFIFIESGGKPDIISPAGAIGLMQLMTSSSDILVIENLKKRLSQPESEVLSKYLGKRFTDGILKMKYLGDSKTIDGITYDGVKQKYLTKTDLTKPSLNILIGSIYIGILIAESSNNGKLDLHKVVVRYNRGYFADKKGSSIPNTIEASLTNMNTESKNYILKLMGVNGTLDTLVV